MDLWSLVTFMALMMTNILFGDPSKATNAFILVIGWFICNRLDDIIRILKEKGDI